MGDRKTFKDVEIEHDLKTYYASGRIEFSITETWGGNYEGYDYERLFNSEVESIDLDELYYIDEDIDDAVHVLGQYKYKEVEQLAKGVVADMYN